MYNQKKKPFHLLSTRQKKTLEDPHVLLHIHSSPPETVQNLKQGLMFCENF